MRSTTYLTAAACTAAELYVGGNGEDNWVGRVWQLQNSGTRLTGTGARSFNLGGGYGSARFGAWFVK